MVFDSVRIAATLQAVRRLSEEQARQHQSDCLVLRIAQLPQSPRLETTTTGDVPDVPTVHSSEKSARTAFSAASVRVSSPPRSNGVCHTW
jgi:hypothetical protein